MKLLVQSDDYGITRAVSRGIIYGITDGIVRNTGLFANMPWAEEVTGWLRPYLDRIAFGIDLNLSTGPSLLGYDRVPGLCHEDGNFYTSRENRAMDTDENGHDHLNHDEVYQEFDAQIQRYIELVGKKPDYIHNHAYGTPTTEKVTGELVRKYGCPFSGDLMKTCAPKNMMSWYRFGGPEEQLKEDLLGYLLRDDGGYLHMDTGYLITHCGYADAPLFALSSFNTCRVKDLEALTSPEVKQWVKENNIELITFRDL